MIEIYEDDVIDAYNLLETTCNMMIQNGTDSYIVRRVREVQELLGDELIAKEICPFCGNDLLEVKETDCGTEERYYCSHCDIEY